MKSKNISEKILIDKIKKELQNHNYENVNENWLKTKKKLIGKRQIENDEFKNKLLKYEGNSKRIYSIAASIALILGLSYFIYQFFIKVEFIEYHTSKDIHQKYELPDGSVVWLNINSKISYPDKFFRNKRILHLEGEAFFNIRPIPGKTYRVLTPFTEIEVVGTEFNVKAYHDENIEVVTVKTGVVSVRRKKIEYLLHPGESSLLNKADSMFIKEENSDVNYEFWKTQKLEFRDTPLNVVIKTLESVFHKRIVIVSAGLDTIGLNATYVNLGLNEILDAIALTLDVEINQGIDSVIIAQPE